MVRQLTTRVGFALLAVLMACRFLMASRFLFSRHRSPYPSQAFSWDEVDLNAVDGCGWVKCFFRSAFNSSVGYTIGYEHKDWGSDKEGVGLFQQLEEAWEVSQEIKRNFSNSVRTGLLQPPERVSIPSEEVLSSLRSAVKTAAEKQIGHFEHLDAISLIRNQSRANNTIVVQKTERFPSLHFILGCPLASRDVRRLESFSKLVGNFTNFDERFEEEMKVLEEVMKVEPRLWSDFQILLDRHGNFYYHDLDRVVGNSPRLKELIAAKNTCLDYLVAIKNVIIAGNETSPQARLPVLKTIFD